MGTWLTKSPCGTFTQGRCAAELIARLSTSFTKYLDGTWMDLVGIEPTASCLQSKRSTPELKALGLCGKALGGVVRLPGLFGRRRLPPRSTTPILVSRSSFRPNKRTILPVHRHPLLHARAAGASTVHPVMYRFLHSMYLHRGTHTPVYPPV